MLLFCFMPSYLGFILANLIWGIAIAEGGTTPTAFAADLTPPGANVSIMSRYRMLGDVSYFIGPIMLGIIADLLTGKMALLVTAVLLIGIGFLFAKNAPETYQGS